MIYPYNLLNMQIIEGWDYSATQQYYDICRSCMSACNIVEAYCDSRTFTIEKVNASPGPTPAIRQSEGINYSYNYEVYCQEAEVAKL